jgi:hypothetical protein
MTTGAEVIEAAVALDQLAERSASLRALADFIDEHRAFLASLPSEVFLTEHPNTVELAFLLVGDGQRALAEQIIRYFGGRWDKDDAGPYFRFVRQPRGEEGQVALRVVADREAVCERVVVGTETVQVPDPDAPLVAVEREVVEWSCQPVLSGAVDAAPA